MQARALASSRVHILILFYVSSNSEMGELVLLQYGLQTLSIDRSSSVRAWVGMFINPLKQYCMTPDSHVVRT